MNSSSFNVNITGEGGSSALSTVIVKSSTTVAGNQSLSPDWLLSANNQVDLSNAGFSAGDVLKIMPCNTGSNAYTSTYVSPGIIISPAQITFTTQYITYNLTYQESSDSAVLDTAIKGEMLGASYRSIISTSSFLDYASYVKLQSQYIYVSFFAISSTNLASGTFNIVVSIPILK